MLEVLLSNRFKKDLKLAKKRGYNLELLYDVVDILARQEPLPEKTPRPRTFRRLHRFP